MRNISANCVQKKAVITKSAINQKMGSIAFNCFHTVQVLTGKQNMGTKLGQVTMSCYTICMFKNVETLKLDL